MVYVSVYMLVVMYVCHVCVCACQCHLFVVLDCISASFPLLCLLSYCVYLKVFSCEGFRMPDFLLSQA